MTNDNLSDCICNSATRLILDANTLIGHVQYGEELDDFISAADFVDVMSVELKAIKTFITMWEEIEE